MERIVEQGILYDFYGALLTAHQQKIYEMIVDGDMSLQEVAQQEGISKQAVSDLVTRATAQMQRYEKALGMIRRFRGIQKELDMLEEKLYNCEDIAEQRFPATKDSEDEGVGQSDHLAPEPFDSVQELAAAVRKSIGRIRKELD